VRRADVCIPLQTADANVLKEIVETRYVILIVVRDDEALDLGDAALTGGGSDPAQGQGGAPGPRP
jgi:hypothetical protein